MPVFKTGYSNLTPKSIEKERKCNCTRAVRLFEAEFPNERRPSRSSFFRLATRLQRTGSVHPTQIRRIKTATGEAQEIAILAAYEENSHQSIRSVARNAGISSGSTHTILCSHGYYLYQARLRQQLYDGDPGACVQFSTWCLERLWDNEGFFMRVLFSDEATFSNLGCGNHHNFRHWASENPRWIREVPLQHRWQLNVWCGIKGEHLIGPYFFDDVLMGRMYGDFLRECLPALLEDVPLEDRARIWFQQDGAPPHHTRANLAHLNFTFLASWIGLGGPIRWPARSPDLTLLDFFLWGTLKGLVFVVPPTTPEDMRQRIVDACTRITVEELRNVQRSFIRRLERCVEQGRYFEHL